MELWTIAMSNWRKAKEKDVKVVDITVKGNAIPFAPSWDMVRRHKDGVSTHEEYTEQYYNMMRESWNTNRAAWMELLNEDAVAISCFCRPGDFCHRHLLKDMLIKAGSSVGIEVLYRGEIK